MSYRRRILMKFLEQGENSNLIDYFKTYRIVDIVSNLKDRYDIRWIGCRLKFENLISVSSHLEQEEVFSIANLYADNSQKNPISVQAAIGYNPEKRYNLKVRVAQKRISHNDDSRVLDFLTFKFLGINDAGSLISKNSQKMSIEDAEEGNEFIIPIETGEYLNNLLIIHEVPVGASATFTLVFEFYFEEITE